MGSVLAFCLQPAPIWIQELTCFFQIASCAAVVTCGCCGLFDCDHQRDQEDDDYDYECHCKNCTKHNPRIGVTILSETERF